ncbi:MAG TPA: DEAD/DEAH box helicase, partial [Thermoanaerobaculia bacterium]|nr:DEAD/DEAH box helicase [Thermoanaerobaculia bacterium]
LARRPDAGVKTLCVSPLKALINDQFRRLEGLCSDLGIPLYRWHGDVPASFKKKLLRHPEGVLVITPESLEALFVLHGSQVGSLFEGLTYAVIDELHAFIGTERGRQLQSQLHRLELVIARRVPRIGLSATLGDMNLAREFLRPGGSATVRCIESSASRQEVRVQVRGYRRAAEVKDQLGPAREAAEAPEDEIANHLFTTLRGTTNLVFANSRAIVEQYADRLRRLCKDLGVPNEFWPHHGNLSKGLRDETEAALKDRSRPGTAICTTTLELGIDIGAIASIAQIGAPPSVSSTRQRLGRSGRGGGPAVLRAYIVERELQRDSPLGDALRVQLVQTIATIDLLLERWCEPPLPVALHLSTLVQQILSLIAQHGALRAAPAWKDLCERGPFSSLRREQFVGVLRSLSRHGLIQQDHSGELVLGAVGERLVNHYGFYAAFTSPEEYRIVADGRVLGSMPVQMSLAVNGLLIFGGRRWRIVRIDPEQKTIDVQPAQGGRPPAFVPTEAPPVHDALRGRMFEIFRQTAVPTYLTDRAIAFLAEARDNFARYRLAEVRWLAEGDSVLIFPWCGDRILDTLGLWMRALGRETVSYGIALCLARTTEREAGHLLETMAASEPPSGTELARAVANLRREKFHPYLDEDLLADDYATSRLDLAGARETVLRLLEPR